ncbi:3-oxoacid CoA-transferase subunit B [Austwickia chelonae]|uniref:3-oxoacid CoA-transferase subunit B n=1 Tax=Austwickia chelonae TaxID=100225 RepID=UPI000E237CE7|nr:3-oxoacid CoA-transferase subunit B [Austwickia chelonae]
MDRNEIKHYIARRAAREFSDGDFVNLGIGVPTLIPAYLSSDVHVTIEAEDGIVGAGPRPPAGEEDPRYLVDAGGSPATCVPGGSFISSVMSFALIRGGHMDATVLGALEVDAEGNLANWIIPGKMVPGMGGAMDLVVGAKRVIVAMEHTQKGAPKIKTRCSLPLTAARCVDLIITEMAVIKVTDEGLVLTEYNPEFTVEQIQAATEAELIISPDLLPIA